MEQSSKLVVFDLDGTLNRTELFSVGVHRMVQTEFGWPAQSPEQIISIFGAPANEYIEGLLPGADDETKRKYLKRVSEAECDLMDLAAAYDGCGEMLDMLHEGGCKTAVCSNSSFRYITTVLKAIKLADKIDFIQPLEPGMTTKGESLRALLTKAGCTDAVMVGDTVYDQQAAIANQIPFIGCNYGYRPHEMKEAEHTVDKPLDIPALINSLID
jgi:phosphoglycolate phosphatase